MSHLRGKSFVFKRESYQPGCERNNSTIWRNEEKLENVLIIIISLGDKSNFLIYIFVFL